MTGSKKRKISSETDPTVEQSSKKEDLLEGLRLILKNESHLFACGGSLPVGEPVKTAESATKVPTPTGDAKKHHDSITIRWDVNDSKDAAGRKKAEACTKLNLPLIPGAGVGGETSLKRLVQHCQPATFGRGGKDVYDESYRRAGKMDPTAFCTTFDPYTAGIIDTVAQVLLPSVYDSVTHRGVRAELYKLNIYSAPSGKFKPHVDTPRSREQFGSLVVCLPVDHEGGQLKVRHKGEEMTFDWSTNPTSQPNQNKKNKSKPDSQAIHWAAFYSDCEHEVLEVTSGHRITLTYNLYAVRGFQRLTGAALSPTPLNPVHLPLFDTIQKTMSQDPFNGQVMALGEHIIMCLEDWYEEHGPNKKPDAEGKKAIETKAPFTWWGQPSQFLESVLPETMPPSEWIIGHKFSPVDADDAGEVEDLAQYAAMYNDFGKYSPTPIHWLNEAPTSKELQMIYIAYGNEASTAAEYSNAAILVTIPPKETKD
ncbi:Adenylyl cyclase-associated protein [Apiospora arundinis]